MAERELQPSPGRAAQAAQRFLETAGFLLAQAAMAVMAASLPDRLVALARSNLYSPKGLFNV
jgi:uncharacterized MAPEG superfamily protein